MESSWGRAAAGLGVKQQRVLLIPRAPSLSGLGCGLVEETDVSHHSQEQTVTTQSHSLD